MPTRSGYVSKDSLSSCDAPSTLYDTIRNPNAISSPLKPLINTQDTLESSGKSVKPEKLFRFQTTGLQLPHESYIAVVQVGKYVFMAVMLPVYLGLYGIPHWFFVSAFPQFLGILKQQSLRIGSFTVELSKKVLDLMKGIMEQLLGDAIRVGKERTQTLWERLARKWTQFTHAIASFNNAIKNGVQQIQEKIKQGLYDLHKRVEHNVQATNKWIHKQMVFLWEKMIKKGRDALNIVDRYLLNPFVKILIPPFKLISKAIELAKRSFLEKMRTLHRLQKKLTDPLKKTFRRITEIITEKVDGVVRPLVYWLQKQQERLHVFFQQVKQTIVDPLKRIISAAKIKLGQWTQHSLTIAKPIFRTMWRGFKGSARFAWKMIPKRIKQNLEHKKRMFDRSWNLLKGAANGMIAIFKWLLKRLQVLLRLCMIGGIYVLRFTKKSARLLWRQLMALPVRAKKVFGKSLKGVAFVGIRIAFIAHLVVVLIALAAIYGFRLTQQISGIRNTP